MAHTCVHISPILAPGVYIIGPCYVFLHLNARLERDYISPRYDIVSMKMRTWGEG